MYLKWKLATDIIDNLFCLCVSANGGLPPGGLTEEQEKLCKDYANNKFQTLLKEWQEITGQKWEIEPPTNLGMY